GRVRPSGGRTTGLGHRWQQFQSDQAAVAPDRGAAASRHLPSRLQHEEGGRSPAGAGRGDRRVRVAAGEAGAHGGWRGMERGRHGGDAVGVSRGGREVSGGCGQEAAGGYWRERGRTAARREVRARRWRSV
ncbi:unnamed protein product, partial [Urochloa humidicola]